MSNDQNTWKSYLHEIIFSGGISKGVTWGGPTCLAAIPYENHIYEMFGWITLSVVMYWGWNLHSYWKEGLQNARKYCMMSEKVRGVLSLRVQPIADAIFIIAHFGLWLSVLYYKINLKSLVNLLQPCHLLLLLQGVTVALPKSMAAESAVMSILLLPLVIGPIAAVACPATDGLDQPYEKEGFWVQHYMQLISPLYMLIRNDFCALKISDVKGVLLGNWLPIALHWYFFAPFDRYFSVNINFWLCPSEGMADAFTLLPTALIWPSYRTFCTILFFIVDIPIIYTYIAVAHFLSTVYGSSHQKLIFASRTNMDENRKFK